MGRWFSLVISNCLQGNGLFTWRFSGSSVNGGANPDVDLLASKFNANLDRFVFRTKDPQAFADFPESKHIGARY